MAKRQAPSPEASAPKRPSFTQTAQLDIGPASGEEDLKLKILQVQNAKLSERLQERNHRNDELESRLKKLEERRDQDLKVMVVLKRLLVSLRRAIGKDSSALSDESLQRLLSGETDDRKCALEDAFQSILENVGTCTTAISVENSSATESLDELDTYKAKCEELENWLADARFDLQKSETKCDHLQTQLSKALEDLNKCSTVPSVCGSSPKVCQSSCPIDENESSKVELVEQHKNLAESRLAEIEALTQKLADVRTELEELKVKQPTINDTAVKDSVPYKTLQTHFSIIYMENTQLRNVLEDLKQLLNAARVQHFSQLEEIRTEEAKYSKEVRDDMSRLEGLLAATKRDYELLKMEHEKMIASNEQAAPIAKELKATVDILQKTIQQLKAEVNRYKTRAHKAEQGNVKATEEKSGEEHISVVTGATSDTLSAGEEYVRKLEGEKRDLESEIAALRELASEKLDEAALAEKKAQYQKDYEKKKEMLREEATRKTKALSEDNKQLHKELSAKKHEAQALMSEMEDTTQAFEEAREQNLRLVQELKEKSDSNLKLIYERIKAASLQKAIQDEKDLLGNQIVVLSAEKSRLNELVTQMEQKEKATETGLQALERDLTVKQQVLEAHRKKALDSCQALQECQLRTQDLEKQLLSAQKSVQSLVEQNEKESSLVRRGQEEITALKRKLERYKNREWGTSSDEVLLEEIKTYQAKLNCPCCSTRKKDTVLTKCFHVFCSECIKSRYDSRLRKCPKCGAAFGANDFHKIYLS
ncbi:hypothetical protein EMCRGX_G027456 [Ephydatia muelleri]